MVKRLLPVGLIVTLALLHLSWYSRAEPPPANLGKPIASFTLSDPRDQGRHSLADFKDKKAIAVLFLGTECPINNAYLPRLAELHREYAAKGVQFLAINANRQDTAERIAAHARKHALPFPVLHDPGNLVADQFGARRNPEAFVLDGTGILRYQGRIDDQYGFGYQRPKPTRRDLAEALDEVLAGKEVSVKTTDVAGCLIARLAPPKTDGEVTYTKHVARIVQRHCQECHRPGQIGPMALETYDDVAAWSGMIREVVGDRRMPPWYADPKHGKFVNDRRLPVEDLQTLLKWIALGCPKGDPKDLPPPAVFAEGWRIGKPDLVLEMPVAFDVPAQTPKGGIPYKHFFIDPGFKEDRWVVRAEAKPGAAAVVHHIVVYVVPPGRLFLRDNPTNIILCGTAPGDMPTIMPPGVGKCIPAGAKLVMQMHYTPNGTACTDRSSVGLIFADGPLKESRSLPVFSALFRIPPGADNHLVESTFTFPEDGEIISFMPHMHLRGKDFLYEAIHPDGKTETLLSVPRYNFNWQNVYRLAEPYRMARGSRIHCIAHFDNSANNPNNPDPTRAVTWGDQTWQEMMIGWLDVVYDRAKR